MLHNLFRSVLPSLFLLIMAGCATTDIATVTPQDFIQSSAQNEPVWASKLLAGDTLEVSVEVDGRMEISRHRANITPQGYATLPLVGDVQVGGMRLETARKRIHKTYSAYYVNPPVTMVSMVSAPDVGEWGYVTVMGRVGNPGRIPLRAADGMTLTEAIQAAGGFAPSAKQNAIRVTRTDSVGKKIQAAVDFEEIGQGGNADADVNLINGDVVYVPERIF